MYCRVIAQNANERNYHIFYQLCTCMAKELRLEGGPASFRYLAQSGCVLADGIDDREDLASVRHAFDVLGFSPADVAWVFETCAGLLHLSNVTFQVRIHTILS